MTRPNTAHSNRKTRFEPNPRHRPSPAARATAAVTTPQGKLRILVVEDEFVSARALAGLLRRYGACEFATRGGAAIDLLEKAQHDGHPFDLVCMDNIMPGLTGVEVLEVIRGWEQRRGVLLGKGVPVIMTTICNDPQTVLGAFNSGCESYLIKPVSAESLAKVLADLGLTPRS